MSALNNMRAHNRVLTAGLTDRTELTAYFGLVRIESGLEFWSDALQRALDEHEVVKIPARHTPYYIDQQIIIGSNRRIEAEGATIILTSDCKLLMLRNSSAANGTYAPICEKERDCNILIIGGRWEKSLRARAGYGSSGKFDSERSFYGISTIFFFNNVDNLTLEGVTFAHTGGFAVQIGDISCAVFEKYAFASVMRTGFMSTETRQS